VDAALRRRFAIIQVPPDYEALAHHLGTPLQEPEAHFKPGATTTEDWSADDVKQLALSLLMTLNHRINFVLGRDFLLGHALLWSVEGSTVKESAEALSRAFDERIASTLRLTFLDQDEALGAILNAGPPPSPNVSGAAVRGLVRWISPPASLQSVATARLEFRDASSMEWPEALRALSSIL
jgi:5-methylcytosine-specific restriction protein B